MPLPNLEDLDEILDRTCADVLGDTIRYKAVGASDFTDVKAHVDYRDLSQPLQGAEVMAQNIAVEIPKSSVLAKPVGKVRIQLPKRPGHTFKPVKVGNDRSGTHWAFELVDVPE